MNDKLNNEDIDIEKEYLQNKYKEANDLNDLCKKYYKLKNSNNAKCNISRIISTEEDIFLIALELYPKYQSIQNLLRILNTYSETSFDEIMNIFYEKRFANFDATKSPLSSFILDQLKFVIKSELENNKKTNHRTNIILENARHSSDFNNNNDYERNNYYDDASDSRCGNDDISMYVKEDDKPEDKKETKPKTKSTFVYDDKYRIKKDTVEQEILIQEKIEIANTKFITLLLDFKKYINPDNLYKYRCFFTEKTAQLLKITCGYTTVIDEYKNNQRMIFGAIDKEFLNYFMESKIDSIDKVIHTNSPYEAKLIEFKLPAKVYIEFMNAILGETVIESNLSGYKSKFKKIYTDSISKE